MIGASYVFYAWWDWHFVWLLRGGHPDRPARRARGGRKQQDPAQRW